MLGPGARTRALFCAALFILSLLVGCKRSATHPREIVVAAATSLRVAMPDLAKAYAQKQGVTVSPTYGASGSLRQQVEAGAPVDAVAFASADPVDALVKSGRVDRDSVRVVARNELVLIGSKGGPALTFATLDAAPPGERIAIGDPSVVPAGSYAQKALKGLGVWSRVEGRLVLAADVGAVLAYVRNKEAVVGIAYRTEVMAAPDVVLLDVASGDWAPRPEVVTAFVTGSREGRDFTEFLSTPEAQSIFRAHGFGAP
jgi:molybdate transport system substrate-binding protein